MLDIGWSELLLIGVVALIVVGPEDLPRMFHALGRMTAKARSMAREFSSAMEEAARQSGIKDATDGLREVKTLTSKKNLGLDALDRAVGNFEKWDPKLPTASRAGGMKPDPAAAGGAVAAMTVPDPAPAPAAAPAASATEPEAAPGRRQLRAVRRSDRQA